MKPTIQESALNTTVLAQDTAAMNQLATLELDTQSKALTPSQADEVLAAGIDLGRLEAMVFITTIGESASLAIYENVKKSKAWAHLCNPNYSDGRKFESLDEFCRTKLGKSYNRLQELSSNRNLIGQAVFEHAEKIGLRQVDYNAIKNLSASDKDLIRRATEEAQSREEVLDLLQELAARNAKEKEGLQLDLAAKDQRIALHAAKIQAFEDKADREAVQPVHALVAEAAAAAIGGVRGRLLQSFQKLQDHHLSTGGDGREVMAGYVGQLQQTLNELRDVFMLADVVGDGTPAWQQWAAEHDAEKDPEQDAEQVGTPA